MKLTSMERRRLVMLVDYKVTELDRQIEYFKDNGYTDNSLLENSKEEYKNIIKKLEGEF